MTFKQLGQTAGIIAGIVGGASGVGATVYSGLKGRLVSRAEYEQAAQDRQATEAARAVQLAGWQSTLNQVVDSQRSANTAIGDIDKKLDAFILEMLRQRSRR